MLLFEYQRLETSSRQIGAARQAIVATADNDGVELPFHRRTLNSHMQIFSPQLVLTFCQQLGLFSTNYYAKIHYLYLHLLRQ